MFEDNQIPLPRSFIDLFIAPGKVKPSETRKAIAARYEFCEDMAQMLTDHAQQKLWNLGITEQDVLERIHRGLLAEGSGLNAGEAQWVTRRLTELLGWPLPSDLA